MTFGLGAWRIVVLYTSQYAPNVTVNVSTLTGPLPCTIAAGLYLRDIPLFFGYALSHSLISKRFSSIITLGAFAYGKLSQ